MSTRSYQSIEDVHLTSYLLIAYLMLTYLITAATDVALCSNEWLVFVFCIKVALCQHTCSKDGAVFDRPFARSPGLVQSAPYLGSGQSRN